MKLNESERFLRQLLVWRGLVAGTGDVSRRALRQALDETDGSRGDVIERALSRHADALAEVA